jgi:hypothetical protein
MFAARGRVHRIAVIHSTVARNPTATDGSFVHDIAAGAVADAARPANPRLIRPQR